MSGDGPHGREGTQQALFGALPGLETAAIGTVPVAAELPIARVYVDKMPLHLDQTFDYAVPADMSDSAVPGTRVKVPFGGQVLTGYVYERTDYTDHAGRLARIKTVVSHGRLLDPHTFELARIVANYYAGTVSDVLRLAVPPRAAKVEKEFYAAPTRPASSHSADSPDDAYAQLGGQQSDTSAPAPVVGQWDRYAAGPAFLSHLATGAPRAVWTALPGLGSNELGHEESQWGLDLWMLSVIEAISVTRSSGRGVLVILPTSREVDRFTDALAATGFTPFTAATGRDPQASADFVRLTHDMGASPRFRSYLAALAGRVNIVVGTRGAAFAPMANLGLAVIWNDADDSHQDLHAPYAHAREVLALRCEQEGAALLIGGFGRSVHAQALVASGWAHELRADRAIVRACAPRVIAFGSQELEYDGRAAQGRLPSRVWTKITAALREGPVLITVPRAGYIPQIACANCRNPAHCAACNGPLSYPDAQGTPQCRWCGALAGNWACPTCHGTTLRAMRIGSDRTAEELGRAFPQTVVRVSGAKSVDGIIARVPARPALVISTPGAEPVADGGYGLAVILDAQVGSAGTGLYADQETLNRWLATATLVRGAAQGGEVYLVGEGAAVPTAALVRWDPVGLAERELVMRQDLHMPPAWRVASVTGDRLAVNQFLDILRMPPGGSVLGPVEIDPVLPRGRGAAQDRLPQGAHQTLTVAVRAIIRVPVGQGRDLARAIKAAQATASARRAAALVSVVLDPKELV